MKAYPEIDIVLEGHCSRAGFLKNAPEFELEGLSIKRAMNVRQLLLEQGCSTEIKLEAKGSKASLDFHGVWLHPFEAKPLDAQERMDHVIGRGQLDFRPKTLELGPRGQGTLDTVAVLLQERRFQVILAVPQHCSELTLNRAQVLAKGIAERSPSSDILLKVAVGNQELTTITVRDYVEQPPPPLPPPVHAPPPEAEPVAEEAVATEHVAGEELFHAHAREVVPEPVVNHLTPQEKISAILQETPISFQSRSAELSSEVLHALTRVSEVLKNEVSKDLCCVVEAYSGHQHLIPDEMAAQIMLERADRLVKILTIEGVQIPLVANGKSGPPDDDPAGTTACVRIVLTQASEFLPDEEKHAMELPDNVVRLPQHVAMASV